MVGMIARPGLSPPSHYFLVQPQVPRAIAEQYPTIFRRDGLVSVESLPVASFFWVDAWVGTLSQP